MSEEEAKYAASGIHGSSFVETMLAMRLAL
jgi:hypothetical protein